MPLFDDLPRRERAVLEALFGLGEATAREVQERLADGTSYSAVRAFLASLESRGMAGHRIDGKRYLWFPVRGAATEGRAALGKAVRVFFDGSRAEAIASLLGSGSKPLEEEEYRRLLELLERSRKRKA